MSVANRRVLADVARWAEVYERGEVPNRFKRAPLVEGERLAVGVFPVRVSVEEAGRPFEEWAPRPGSRALRPPFRNDGVFYVTSSRLLTMRRSTRGAAEVTHEWTWSDVGSVEVVPNWRGVSLHLPADLEHVVVIGNVFHTFVVRPSPVALAASWAKVVGAWAENRGHLAAWLRALAARLGEEPR
jgi:hypothetical protein